jgi:hypothetical protein
MKSYATMTFTQTIYIVYCHDAAPKTITQLRLNLSTGSPGVQIAPERVCLGDL